MRAHAATVPATVRITSGRGDKMKRWWSLLLAGASITMLGACAIVPAGGVYVEGRHPGYYGGPPAAVVVPPPVVVRPWHRPWGWYGHGRGHGRGYRY